MVRLKGRVEMKDSYYPIKFQFQYGAIKSQEWQTFAVHSIKFQFQYGAIKSVDIRDGLREYRLFQFQYGAIKRIGRNSLISALSVFQFQYGAIKRPLIVHKRIGVEGFNSNMVRLKEGFPTYQIELGKMFQFQYGAIKSQTGHDYHSCYHVSIPIWCD